ncbi:hypothetical protein LIA77_09032 [Sarocladium implicatum]|nr:hypothetical protein LIA77_09032 [Sarocladium implicatum]
MTRSEHNFYSLIVSRPKTVIGSSQNLACLRNNNYGTVHHMRSERQDSLGRDVPDHTTMGILTDLD